MKYLTKSHCMTAIGRWMNDLRFYVLFNSILIISGRWADDKERMCAMEPVYDKKDPRSGGLEPGTARSLGQRITHRATGNPREQPFTLKEVIRLALTSQTIYQPNTTI